jgi:hypothetical protein
MKRRVGMGSNQSELAVVKGQYEACIEEHLGASIRNLWRVDLDGTGPLCTGQYRMIFRTD